MLVNVTSCPNTTTTSFKNSQHPAPQSPLPQQCVSPQLIAGRSIGHEPGDTTSHRGHSAQLASRLKLQINTALPFHARGEHRDDQAWGDSAALSEKCANHKRATSDTKKKKQKKDDSSARFAVTTPAIRAIIPQKRGFEEKTNTYTDSTKD